MPGFSTSHPDQRLLDELPRIRSLVRRLAAGRPDREELTEEVVQEVCVRALRSMAGYDRDRPMRAWVGAIAFRTFLDLRRPPNAVPVEDAEPLAPDDQASIERRDLLGHLLGRIPEPERGILVRFHRDGASLGEIARALRMPAGTVKSHLHRARKRLARMELEP